MSVKEKHKSATNQKSKKRTHSSDSGSDSEHELFYYANDRVRLMKEVLKILKLKKIKSLAPDGIKSMDMEEINTLLLEELLGISNKRLKRIFDGLHADDESSSSDEDKTVDIISLDSISDDEICFIDETKDDGTGTASRSKDKHGHRKHKVKKEPVETKIKTETAKPEKSIDKATGLENEKLLSVLELLELQARARAIRSQLALEAESKAKEKEASIASKAHESDDDDAVVIEVPTVNEIVISSSDSEPEDSAKASSKENGVVKNVDISAVKTTPPKKVQKIKLIRSIIVETAPVTALAAPVAVVSDIPLPVFPLSVPTDNTDAHVEDANSQVNTDKEHDINLTDKAAVDKVEERNVAAIEIEKTNETQTECKPSKVMSATMADKRRPSSDADDDVIRLDVVEIDGIDD